MGTWVTCCGSIIIMSTNTNATVRPRHRSRASAYAAGMLESSMNAVASPA